MTEPGGQPAREGTEPRPVPDLGALLGPTSLPAWRETPDDTGNAHRFARLWGDRVRYLAAEKTWLLWDGTRLARDEVGRVYHLTEAVCDDVRAHIASVDEDQRPVWARWASTASSAGRREATLRVASTLPDLVIAPGELDDAGHLLNTPSGTVDLRDGSLKPWDLADKLTHLTGVGYDPAIVWTPLLAEYAATFVPDYAEWRYLMKLLGSTLLAGNEFRLWLIMHGPTTTGKSQLVNAIAKVLGDYGVSVNSSVFRANLDDKPRPDLLRALSARLVYALEASDHWELHGDHVKRLTGAEPIVARGMRSDVMVERVPDFTPFVVCNSIPRLKGNADAGVRRRLRVIPMTHSVIGNEDPRKRTAFENDEATKAALLSQLVEGAVRSQAEGVEADLPARFAEATLAAFGELNNVADFLGYLRDSGALIEDDAYLAHRCWRAEELYSRYVMWISLYGSAEDKRGQLGLRQFNGELRDQGWVTVRSDGLRWQGKVNTGPYG